MEDLPSTFDNLKVNSTKHTTSCAKVGSLMCLVWEVDGQGAPHTRLRGVTSILNHMTSILHCDGKNRVISESVTAKVP